MAGDLHRNEARPTNRRAATTFDFPFTVRFVERLYSGPPRWFGRDWHVHHDRVAGANGERLDREPEVKNMMAEAHDHNSLYGAHNTYLIWCTNPACSSRAGGAFVPGDPAVLAKFRGFVESFEFTKRLHEAFRDVAEGHLEKLDDRCPNCGGPQPIFPIIPIEDKWIYVLKDTGQTLTPYCEIQVLTPNKGHIYTRMREGMFVDKPSQPFLGYLNIVPDLRAHSCHFFLSPVRLGPKSLDLLCKSPQKQKRFEQARQDHALRKRGVPFVDDTQPWKTTVELKFSSSQVRTSFEPIALVDPFAWVAEAIEFDYEPILDTLLRLVQDPDEQAKAFVAGVLHSSMARVIADSDPPKWVDDDKWDVRDDTVDPPVRYKSSGNIAKAWLDRYSEAFGYLTAEADRAFARVEAPIRFAQAHRIVEAACQERPGQPGFLSYGLVHWVHLLSTAQLCEAGKTFYQWLYTDDEATELIPRANVLRKKDLGPDADVADDVGDLPQQILGLLAPMIVRTHSPNSALDAICSHLRELGTLVHVSESKVAKAFKESAKNFPKMANSAIDKYNKMLIEKLGEAAEKSFHGNWGKKLGKAGKAVEKPFLTVELLLDAVALYIGLKGYSSSPKAYNSFYDQASSVKTKLETPFKVADYIAKCSRTYLKESSKDKIGEIMRKLDKEGPKAKLAAEEVQLVIETRSLRSFRGLWKVGKFLAGPVGAVLGGADLALCGIKTSEDWKAGDPGSAAGYALQAAGAALTVVVGVGESIALASGSAVLWVTPVGWIAAVLIVGGVIVIACCSKNDLEKFAQHCWLGEEYGYGDRDSKTGMCWMYDQPWPSLRYEDGSTESKHRFNRQRAALMRLISGFATCCHAGSFCGGRITPGLVSGNAVFEVEVEVKPKGQASPREIFRARIWAAVGEYAWENPVPHRDSSIHVETGPNGAALSITVRALPNTITSSSVDYVFRVRLDLDGSTAEFGQGSFYLPASKNWVTNHSSGYNVVHSSSVT